MKTKILDLKSESLPPSCLGPDGKFKREGEEDRRKRLESARQRLREIAQIPNEPNDPPDEEWMRDRRDASTPALVQGLLLIHAGVRGARRRPAGSRVPTAWNGLG